MARPYTSFLIRLWHRKPELMRIRIEHIQSGEVTQVKSLTEAMAWLSLHSNAPPPQALEEESSEAIG